MLQSKSLKRFEDKGYSKFYTWWLESRIVDFFYRIYCKILSPFHHTKKVYAWHRLLLNDFDFDFHSTFAILEFKFKRLQKCLEDGYAIQATQDMKALKLAIKLAGRLKDDRYEEAAYDRFENKWGKLITWSKPSKRYPDMSEWHSRYANVNTDEDKKRCDDDRRAMYLAVDKRTKREEKWLYNIMHKYGRSWWD